MPEDVNRPPNSNDQHTVESRWRPSAQSVGNALGLLVVGASAVGGVVALWFDTNASLTERLWLSSAWLLILVAMIVTLSWAQNLRDQASKCALGSADRKAGDRDAISATVVADVVIFFLGGLVVVSFWAGPIGRVWATGVGWALCCTTLGGMVGFIFGIPKSRSGSQVQVVSPQPNSSASQTQASVEQKVAQHQTPIEQISDWLTKMIVGAGLINLEKIPGQLKRLADFIACARGASGGCSEQPFIVAMIIYFAVIGLMGGYLLTQMYLIGLVNQLTES